MGFNKEKLIEARSDDKRILEFIKNRDEDFFAYIKGFVHKEENKKIEGKSYDIAIYTIGFSPYTTILSISALRPKEKIILVFTKASLKFKRVFLEYFNTIDLDSEIIFIETKFNSDTAEVFKIIFEVMKTYSGKDIAVDITGGKKPTIAAGYLAASLNNYLNNVDILYLDFHDYEDDRPVYGTEYLNILLNPNNIFNTIERRALEEMYLSKNFKGARRLSKEIHSRLKSSAKILAQYSMETQIFKIEKIYYFSKLYELRNDFNYKDIVVDKKYLTKEEIHGISILKNFFERIENMKKENIRLNSESIYKEFKDSDEIFYMVLERYNGALMIKDIDLQSYIIRLLSCIELAGIILTKGTKERAIDKINKVEGLKLKKDLHELRIYRNSLNINHGFTPTVAPKQRYESAVLKYISLVFDKTLIEIKKIVVDNLRYRNYKEIDI